MSDVVPCCRKLNNRKKSGKEKEEAVIRKGKATIMMGKKERSFAPLINMSLEALVPADHFYRHLERTLDLSLVREFEIHPLLWRLEIYRLTHQLIVSNLAEVVQ